MRHILLLLALPLTVAALWAGIHCCRFMKCMNTWEYSYELAEVDVGEGRRIVIEGQRYHDEGQALRYSVFDRDTCVVRNAPLGFSWGGIREATYMVHPAGGNLVVLTETNAPRRVVVLHDFQSGYSFPADFEGYDSDSRFRPLLELVKKAHPKRGLMAE